MRANPECQMQPEISILKKQQSSLECRGQIPAADLIARQPFAIPVFRLNPFFMSKEYQGVVLLPAF